MKVSVALIAMKLSGKAIFSDVLSQTVDFKCADGLGLSSMSTAGKCCGSSAAWLHPSHRSTTTPPWWKPLQHPPQQVVY